VRAARGVPVAAGGVDSLTGRTEEAAGLAGRRGDRPGPRCGGWLGLKHGVGALAPRRAAWAAQ
jgi:hypothetical protein